MNRYRLLLLLLLLPTSPVWADEIKLKDGTKISGEIVGKEGNTIFVGIPHEAIDTVNGKPLPPPVAAGEAAPAFTAVDLDGNAQTVPDPSGRVTLMQFWATWCPHCRSDVPLMKSLTAKYPQGFRVLAVSVDQDAAKLEAFVKDQQLPYPVIATRGPSVPKEQAALPDRYEARGVPTYCLIDAAGKIVHTSSGSFTETRSDLEGLLKPLLAGSKQSASAAR